MQNNSLSVGSHVRSSVFCDYLDVTCSPDDSFIPVIDSWLVMNGFQVISNDDLATDPDNAKTRLYRVNGGVVKLERAFNFHRASASGSVVSHLRAAHLFRDYVNLLGSVPHKVTRLDATLDVAIDAPIVLGALASAYPDGSYSFGRKALRIKTIYEKRLSDNVPTGTMYMGHLSSARVSGRVYDKQQERFNHGIVIPPLTRYELTFRKDYGASLWDALMPKSIFYTHSSGMIDPPTDGFDLWESRGLVPWVSEPVDTQPTIERFAARVRYCPDLHYLVRMASQFGPEGKAIVLREFERQLSDSFAAPTVGDSAA